ncbi:MAG TPA: APC family permease [Verrucomicrobiae bacterium]|nr:APC family permease [Verrucomicrobiae bacterium]
MDNSVSEPEPRLPQLMRSRLKRVLFGAPRDLHDPSIGHKISLIAFLAWVGLGADGLSSSAYGPEEAFRALGNHLYLAVLLGLATAATVFIISYAYSRIIEHFPGGGGGYIVATELLGPSAGVVSGCALLVDYILTITVSIASGADALFSLLPLSFQHLKLPVEFAAIIFLVVMNLRGVKESVSMLVPIFLTFVATHVILIFGGLMLHASALPVVANNVRSGFGRGAAELGIWGMFVLFLRAYSIGGGTYTGIEAVSNGLAIMREPKVETGKRTMRYMAISLAATAAGLLFCYMLFSVAPVEGKTLNAVLAEEFAGKFRLGSLPVGIWFVGITILSEAVLLFVAAQTGFIDGPRVMANMAIDSWLPRRFAALSDRLTSQNGVLLMGITAAAALLYTRGDIHILVVMYSINVFATFSLSEFGMSRFWIRHRKTDKKWMQHLSVHGTGLVMCLSILTIMVSMKLREGGWITLVITLLCIGGCFGIRHHYRRFTQRLRQVEAALEDIPGAPNQTAPPFDPKKPTAVILVGGFAKLGVHCMLNIFRIFPRSFTNVVFVSIGVPNSDFFKGGSHVEELEERTRASLNRYVDMANRLGIPAESSYRIGTDVVNEVSEICVDLSKKYPHAVFFAGEVVFDEPKWYDRILHNETAYAIQRRLRFAGVPIVILPIRLFRNRKIGPSAPAPAPA